jgi:hypothetical protein
MPAEGHQPAAPTHQHPSRKYTVGLVDRVAESSESGTGPAGGEQRETQRREHICNPTLCTGPARQSQTGSQFPNASVGISKVAEHYAGRLMGDGCLIGTRPPGQHGAGPRQSLMGT